MAVFEYQSFRAHIWSNVSISSDVIYSCHVVIGWWCLAVNGWKTYIYCYRTGHKPPPPPITLSLIPSNICQALALTSTWKVPYSPLLYCMLSKIMFHYLKGFVLLDDIYHKIKGWLFGSCWALYTLRLYLNQGTCTTGHTVTFIRNKWSTLVFLRPPL